LYEQFGASAVPRVAKADVFKAFWRLGLLALDGLEGIDWSWLSMDGAMTKAPLGGEKTAPILWIAAKAAQNAVC
jgi:hypothetical protein